MIQYGFGWHVNPLLMISFWVSLTAHACDRVVQPQYIAAEYYKKAEEKLGRSLKLALNSIIKGHIAYPYTPCTWRILEEADEDPENSDNIIAIYTRKSIPKAQKDQGGETPDHWNREHVWPKIQGFPSRDQHAFSDAHMLRAADKSTNADRSSKNFASGGALHDECKDCRSTWHTWEPPDVVKGDLARALFYMDVRYEGMDSSLTPNLRLVKKNAQNGQPELGQLCHLLSWHREDPVSTEEHSRNDIVYAWQGNRNPFIDRPEWVSAIWGDVCK